MAYRELFRYELDPGVVDAIRKATNGNFALGDPRFCRRRHYARSAGGGARQFRAAM